MKNIVYLFGDHLFLIVGQRVVSVLGFLDRSLALKRYLADRGDLLGSRCCRIDIGVVLIDKLVVPFYGVLEGFTVAAAHH